MTTKFRDVVTKADWAKIIILIVISSVCWVWVWNEYQKPIIPEEWQKNIMENQVQNPNR